MYIRLHVRKLMKRNKKNTKKDKEKKKKKTINKKKMNEKIKNKTKKNIEGISVVMGGTMAPAIFKPEKNLVFSG